MGLARRRLYKPERKPARAKGGLTDKDTPISLPNATRREVVMALTVLCKKVRVVPGRGVGYEPLRDEYKVIGKSMVTGKAQDFTVRGVDVADLIKEFRSLRTIQEITAPTMGIAGPRPRAA